MSDAFEDNTRWGAELRRYQARTSKPAEQASDRMPTATPAVPVAGPVRPTRRSGPRRGRR